LSKKITALFIVVIVLQALLGTALGSLADNRTYSVSGYNVNVEIKPDGSADIAEKITYSFNGQFNGILRDVDFSLTSGIDNLSVYVEKDGALTSWKLNSDSNLDASGDPGTYNYVIDGNLARLKIFERSSNEDKTFVIKYTLRDVVTKYNDIATFNRKIIDSGWDVPIRGITVDITLPDGAARDDIKVFGHGPLTGESAIIDERHVRFTLDMLPPGNWMETLVLFPTRLVPDASNIVPRNELQNIMDNEKKLAEEANKERERARQQVAEYERRKQEAERQRQAEAARIAAIRPYGNAVAILLSILWLVIIIHLYKKYDKEFKHNFEGKYYRELPGEYTPAEMSVLLTMGQVNTRDITATLMDLVRKRILLIDNRTYTKKGFFKDKKITDYAISINPDAPPANLKSHESYLIEWFVERIGNGNSVLLDEISAYARTTAGARRFSQDYDRWCALVKEEADKNNFFDETCKKGRTIGILASLAYLAAGILVISVFRSFMGIILFILFLVLFIFSIRINRRTAYGSEQYAMWQAFKNFLKDFSHLDKAEIPSIIIWEHYLVYAISLGVAKEVIRQLPLVFTDADLADNNLTFIYGFNYANFHMFTDTFDKTIDTVDNAISHAISIANSTNSSASGGGGGFSGGTSGGGGGGGGGGAF